MFVYEWKKILFYRRGMFVILLLAFAEIVSTCFFTEDYDAELEANREVYDTYLAQVEGPLTEENRELIEAEMERLKEQNMEILELQDAYYSGELTEEEYEEQAAPLLEDAEKYDGFMKLYTQYIFVRSDDTRQFLYWGGWCGLFDLQEPDYLLVLALIILIAPMFCEEYRSGMDTMLLTQKKSAGRQTRSKVLAAVSLSTLLILFIEVLHLIYYAVAYGLPHPEYTLQSLYTFGGTGKELAIWQAWLLVFVLKQLGGMLAVMLILAFSVFFKTYALTLMSSVVALLLPILSVSDYTSFLKIPMPWALMIGTLYLNPTESETSAYTGAAVTTFTEVSAKEIWLLAGEAVLLMTVLYWYIWRKNTNYYVRRRLGVGKSRRSDKRFHGQDGENPSQKIRFPKRISLRKSENLTDSNNKNPAGSSDRIEADCNDKNLAGNHDRNAAGVRMLLIALSMISVTGASGCANSPAADDISQATSQAETLQVASDTNASTTDDVATDEVADATGNYDLGVNASDTDASTIDATGTDATATDATLTDASTGGTAGSWLSADDDRILCNLSRYSALGWYANDRYLVIGSYYFGLEDEEGAKIISLTTGERLNFPLDAFPSGYAWSQSILYGEDDTFYYLKAETDGSSDSYRIMKFDLSAMSETTYYRIAQGGTTSWFFGLLSRSDDSEELNRLMNAGAFFVRGNRFYYISEGTLYSQSALTGSLTAYDVEIGGSDIAYDGDNLYYTDSKGYLVVYHLDTEEEISHKEVKASGIGLTPDGLLYFNSRDSGALYLWNPNTGETKKISEITGSEIAWDEYFYWVVTDGEVGEILCRIDRATGAAAWSEEFEGFITTLAVPETGDSVYVLDEEGNIWRLDKEMLLWE
ncbi:MAG: hypothetical protein LUE29_09160 [Lachnospiraceae bacterium]|nr:hypothetical protein [Lachnospiraceae bacterium]